MYPTYLHILYLYSTSKYINRFSILTKTIYQVANVSRGWADRWWLQLHYASDHV